MRITAAIVQAPGAAFQLQPVELAAPRDDELIVRVTAAGICHTDLFRRDYPEADMFPAILGHEGAGVAETVGSAVTKVQPGDHVLLTFRSCGHCSRCARHEPALCARFAELNFTGAREDGTSTLTDPENGSTIAGSFFAQSSFASHALVYERNIVKIARDLPLNIYAPLGCGIQTGAGTVMRSLACPAGSRLVVIGCGAVGMSAVLAAVVRACESIIVIEPHAGRRELALELGATAAIDPASGGIAVQVRAHARGLVDFIVDTSGHVPALEEVPDYAAAGAEVALVGLPRDPAALLPIPISRLMGLGLKVRAVLEGDSDPDSFIPELIALHQSGRFPIDRLIREYPFEDIEEAISDMASGSTLKAVLTMASSPEMLA